MPSRILIADDNVVFRTALRQVLQAVDHWDIIEASDGQEAISKAAETLPDVIVLDLAMPAKDGLAAAREISQLLPQIPIVMCTMHVSPHVESEAMKSGVRKVLSKSDSSLLIETVRQFLETPEISVPAAAVDPVILPEPNIAAVLPALPSTPSEPTTDPPKEPLPKNVA